MKTKIFFIVFAVIAFISCEDMEFIEESPESAYFLQEVNEQTLEGLVYGVYEPLSRSRGRLWESVYGNLLDLMADHARSRLGGVYGQAMTYDFENLDERWNGAAWTTFYEAIGRANFLINSVQGNSALSQDQIDRAVGEASFVRAICYFSIVRVWGEAPLRLTPVTNPTESGLAVSSIDAIYDQIIADLTVAEQTLPLTVSAEIAGRATQGAAKVALADVYLARQDFANARTKAQEVINNKGQYGYDLEPSLELIYSPSSPTNTDDVFSIKFAQISGQGSFLPTYAADSRAFDAGLAARGFRRLLAFDTIPFIRDWDRNDLRFSFNLYDSIEINGEKLIINQETDVFVDLGFADYLYGKYQDPNSDGETGAGNDYYLYRYADALLIFAEAENQLNGPTNEAYDAINQVRRRGYGVDINAPSVTADLPAGLSQSDFDDMVFRERGYEFFFEGKRWFDLKRTGRWAEKAAEGFKPAPSREFWKIPQVEVLNNPEVAAE